MQELLGVKGGIRFIKEVKAGAHLNLDFTPFVN